MELPFNGSSLEDDCGQGSGLLPALPPDKIDGRNARRNHTNSLQHYGLPQRRSHCIVGDELQRAVAPCQSYASQEYLEGISRSEFGLGLHTWSSVLSLSVASVT